MDEHSADKDELLYLECFQTVKKLARVPHDDLLIGDSRLSGEIKVGGKVDHGDDAPTVDGANAASKLWLSVKSMQMRSASLGG